MARAAEGGSVASHRSRLWSVALLAVLAGVSTAWCLLSRLPPLKEEELAVLRAFPPRTLPDLAAQRDVLLRYAEAAPAAVLAGFCAAYVAMQACAVPGTVALSVLAGALWGPWAGVPLVAAVSTAGSCACYCLSAAVGRPAARALWPDRLERYGAEVARRRAALLRYMLFLRLTPLVPNTFINVASPVVGVPLRTFALGTLLGVLPNNVVAVNAGAHLSEMHSLADLWSPRLLALGCCVGVLALAPGLLKPRHAGHAAAAAAAAAAGAAKAGKLA